MSIFAPALGALWRQLEGYGIDPEPLFREEGIDPEALFDAGARVSVEKSNRLESRAATLSGDACFGLRSAEYFRPAHLGALGFAWLASSSLRAAFERLSRYARVIQEQLAVELAEDDRHFFVQIDTQLAAGGDVFREDRQLAALTKFCRIIAGRQFTPARIAFRQDTPADTSHHYALFRCPLAFAQPATRIVVARADVDRRLTGANDELAELNEHIVVRYLAHRSRQDIVSRVKAAIIDGLAQGAVTESGIAEQMHMTPRNLHRRLQKEETSFKRLLTDVRQDLARRYIQDRSKSLTEISYLLGFSEVSSFSRAYKGWTGQPPSEARRDVV